VIVIPKDEMVRLLAQRDVSDDLISHVLGRHASMEKALIDELSSTTEKRLARTLLLLARYGTRARPQPVLRHVTDAMLAGLVDAPPARIASLLNTFRRAGYIKHNGRLVVDPSLVNVLLRD
jgi:CRP-like cAMP-binding protein